MGWISRELCEEQTRKWNDDLTTLYDGCMSSARANGYISIFLSTFVIVVMVLTAGASGDYSDLNVHPVLIAVLMVVVCVVKLAQLLFNFDLASKQSHDDKAALRHQLVVVRGLRFSGDHHDGVSKEEFDKVRKGVCQVILDSPDHLIDSKTREECQEDLKKFREERQAKWQSERKARKSGTEAEKWKSDLNKELLLDFVEAIDAGTKLARRYARGFSCARWAFAIAELGFSVAILIVNILILAGWESNVWHMSDWVVVFASLTAISKGLQIALEIDLKAAEVKLVYQAFCEFQERVKTDKTNLDAFPLNKDLALELEELSEDFESLVMNYADWLDWREHKPIDEDHDTKLSL